MANVFQQKQMSHLTCPQKETAHRTHLHNGQHTGNTSYAPPISLHRTTVRPQMDNTHTEHSQQSTEDTKIRKEKKYRTSLHNCKITGIQNNSQTSTWICISHLGHTAKDTYSPNKIQKYAARWVHRDNSHYTSVSSLQKQLNWPSLSDWRLQSRLVLFYKICHQNIAIPIPSHLQIPLGTTCHT